MKNLKKTLAVVLAFAMILGMSAISTLAYTDVAEGTIVSEAVSILSNLEILTGFEDGTFRPSETVTRAQMAAIICRVLGYEDQAESSKGSTIFNDVAADHWASGYINVAQAQQIINGYGDGNYGPEDKVTYEQAVKMIVSALGYDLPAQDKGGYPTGYLAIASTKGITKNANGRVGDAAARSTIAVLTYNALEVELMDQTSWSTGAAGNEFGKTGETVLSRYLGVKKYEGVVTTTPLTEAVSGYNVEDKAVVGFASVKSWGFNAAGNYVLQADSLAGNVNASLVKDADKYLGKKVVAYIGTEADVATGEVMVYALAEKQGSNASLKINATQLVEDTTETDKLIYKKNNKKTEASLNLTTVYVNYATESAIDEVVEKDAYRESHSGSLDGYERPSATALNTKDFTTLLVNGGTIELIDSDTTVSGYETAIITRYDDEAVVEEVEADEMDIFFTTYTGTLADIDLEAEDELVIVYKDGEIADVKDIAKGDTVTTAQINGDDVRLLFVSSKNVTGTVDGWTSTEVEIAGEKYVPSAQGPSLGALQNAEGIFYLNVDGQIAYADASVAKGSYGFILNVYYETVAGKTKYYATVVGADGAATVYEFAKANKIDGVDKTNATAFAAIQAIMSTVDHTYSGDVANAHVDTAADLLFEVKVKNGEIKDLKTVTASTPSSTSEYNESKKALGSKKFDESSVMFALEGAYDSKAQIEEEDIQVGKVVEFLADGEDYYVAAADFANRIYNVAIGYSLVASIPADAELIVITDTKTKSYNDSAATVITGLQAGKEVTYMIYNEDETYTDDPTALVAGDIIVTTAPNAEGTVKDIELIYDGTTLASDVSADDLYYFVDEYDYAAGTSDDFIYFQNPDDVTTTESGKHYVIMDSAANYTLVDYTEDASEPEIAKKSAGKSLFGNISRYDSKIFVRVIDEVLVDVVVYRTNK